MIDPNFVLLGAVLQVVGSYSYLKETLQGKVKPNRVSWLLWAIAPLIAFFAELNQGVGIQSLTTFIVGFVPLVIFIASFVNKKSSWALNKFDATCGIFSILGLVLWYLTQSGNIAILFSILADGLASVPTVIKSYSNPETENSTLFWFGVINAVLGLLVIQTWNFEHWAFPAYLFFMNLLLATTIQLRQKTIKTWK